MPHDPRPRHESVLPVMDARVYHLTALRLAILCSAALTFILISALLETHSGNQHWYMNLHFWATVLRELGFAFIIAILVGLIYEQAASRQAVYHVDAAIQSIGSNVFEAILGSRLPNSIAHHTIDSVLGFHYYRPFVELTYTLQHIPDGMGDAAQRARHVVVYVELKYRIQTVVDYPCSPKIQVTLPISPVSSFSGLVCLTHCQIGSTVLSKQDILSARSENAAGDNISYDFNKGLRFKIQPHGSLDVRLCYAIVRPAPGYEVWRSSMCGEKLTVRIKNKFREMTVKAEGHGPTLHLVEPQLDPDEVVYETAKPLLPQQGIMIWWRMLHDDAEANRITEDVQKV